MSVFFLLLGSQNYAVEEGDKGGRSVSCTYPVAVNVRDPDSVPGAETRGDGANRSEWPLAFDNVEPKVEICL